jgi:hypothetical protein
MVKLNEGANKECVNAYRRKEKLYEGRKTRKIRGRER